MKIYDKYTAHQILVTQRSLFGGPSLTETREALHPLGYLNGRGKDIFARVLLGGGVSILRG